MERPTEHWDLDVWENGDPECWVTLDYDPCYDSEGQPYYDDGDELCPLKFESYSLSDGRCVAFTTHADNPESLCFITDPMVQDCSLADGCCDDQRAHFRPWCS